MRRPEEIEVGRQERNWGDVLRTRTGDDCVSAEDLIAFVEARLDSASRMKVVQHLGHCAGCRDTVFLMRAADRAAQPRTRGIQRFAVGLGFGFGIAVVAGAFVIATNLWNPAKLRPGQGTPVAMNEPKTPVHPSAIDPAPSGNLVTSNPPATATNSGTKPAPSPSTRPTTKTGNEGPNEGSSVKPTGAKPNSTAVKKPSEPTKPNLFVKEPNREVVAMATTSDTSQRALKFYLVGQDHVFSMDSKDAHQSERQVIEQDYAENVANIQADYKKALESGTDPDVAADDLSASLQKAASDRDARLGNLFTPADDLREAHPELAIQGDAPYQVVEVRYHGPAVTPVFDSFQVYAPWPGYVVEDRPYGWSYGVVYTPERFRSTYRTWHQGFVASGRTFSGLRGHSGHVEADLIAQGPGRYGLHSLAGRSIARSSTGATGRYSTSTSGTASRYSRGALGSTSGTSGYGRSAARPTSSGSKYANSARTGSSNYGASRTSAASTTGRYNSKLGAGTSGYRRGITSGSSANVGRYGSTSQGTQRGYSSPRGSGSTGDRATTGPSTYGRGSSHNASGSGSYGTGSTRSSGGPTRSGSSTSRPISGAYSGGRPSSSFGGTRSPGRSPSSSPVRAGGSPRSGHH